jgi:hypothetical protein
MAWIETVVTCVSSTLKSLRLPPAWFLPSDILLALRCHADKDTKSRLPHPQLRPMWTTHTLANTNVCSLYAAHSAITMIQHAAVDIPALPSIATSMAHVTRTRSRVPPQQQCTMPTLWWCPRYINIHHPICLHSDGVICLANGYDLATSPRPNNQCWISAIAYGHRSEGSWTKCSTSCGNHWAR